MKAGSASRATLTRSAALSLLLALPSLAASPDPGLLRQPDIARFDLPAASLSAPGQPAITGLRAETGDGLTHVIVDGAGREDGQPLALEFTLRPDEDMPSATSVLDAQATDADGRALDTRVLGRGRSFNVTVFDAGARYPLAVALRTSAGDAGDQRGDGLAEPGLLEPDLGDLAPAPISMSGPLPCNYLDVAAGNGFTIAVGNDHLVYGWGNGRLLQLGAGSGHQRSVPYEIPGISGVDEVAAGGAHVLALKTDGSVWSWGDNTYGQLGHGNAISTATPTQVVLPGTMVAIAAGREHSLALASTGIIYAWGRNLWGQLGDNTNSQKESPVQVHVLTTAEGIAAGLEHSIALTVEGDVYTWGRDNKGQLGDGAAIPESRVPIPADTPPTMVAVAAGLDHCVALRANGEVYAWGDNANGQVGDGTLTQKVVPVLITMPGPVDAIAAGARHSLAIRDDGTALAWGRNANGELGDGTTVQRTSPVAVQGLASIGRLTGGEGHSVALTTGGKILAWGSPNFGQLGNGVAAYSPEILRTHGEDVNTEFLLDASDIALGGRHTLAIKAGLVYAWGDNSHGQLGDNTTIAKKVPVLVHMPGGVLAARVAAGARHSMALTTTGLVYAWGDNAGGKLGDLSATQRLEPVQVKGPSGIGFLTGVAAIAAGDDHSLALKSDDSVWSWGSDTEGQLGNGALGSRSAPGTVPAFPAGSLVGAIAAGGYHSLAAKSAFGGDGTVWGWGKNNRGQVGDASTTTRQSPVLVTFAAPFCSAAGVDAGDFFSVAWCTSGDAWAWGTGVDGQLGNGTHGPLSRTTPLQIVLPLDVNEMSAGARHVVARHTNGSVRVWGDNIQGQLGNGTFNYSPPPLPAAVPGIVDAVRVAAGGSFATGGDSHSFALTDAGPLAPTLTWAWGAGLHGQLGVGEVVAQSLAVKPRLGPHCENQAPTVSAGPDQSVACDGVLLAGEASDPDDDPLTYLWEPVFPCEASFDDPEILDPVVTFGSDCGVTCELMLTVTDANDVSVADTVVIDVNDLEIPTVAITGSLDDCYASEAEAADAARAAVTSSDNCAILVENVVIVGGCVAEITVTALDGCENVSLAVTLPSTRIDGEAPVLAGAPADDVVPCDDIPDPPVVTALDNCDGAVAVGYASVTTPGGCAGQATITRTWTSADSCGNPASAQQVLTVVDTTPPTLVGVPDSETVQCGQVPDPPNVTATDTCDPSPEVFHYSTPHDGPCSGTYSVDLFWDAYDACGNLAQAQRTLTVIDTLPPVISGVPAGSTVACDAIPPPPSPTAEDLCDSEPTLVFNESIQPVGCADNYDIVRTWTSEDDCGNEGVATQTIQVRDVTAPVLSGVPADVTVECDDIPPAADPTATDGCGDPAPVVSFGETSTPPGACPGSYTITRTWTATDRCGNSSVDEQVITVQDTTDPVLQGVPADTTADCDDIPAPASVTATDNCGSAITTLTETSTAGPCADTYVLHRTWTAVDQCGNSSSATQNIAISDTAAPVLLGVPGDIAVECDEVPDEPVVLADDDCDLAPSVGMVEQRTDGLCDDSYTLVRTWTATDRCGNSSSASQTIVVTDTTIPVLSGVPADTSVACNGVPPPAAVSASDNCAPPPVVVFFENRIDGPCPDSYTLHRLWTATDRCGNFASGGQVITVTDDDAPVLSGVPVDATVQCNAIPPPATPTANDNCDPSPVITFLETTGSGSCAGNYTLTRQWTATDRCGNATVATQVVTVQDTQKPVVTPATGDLYCLWPANHQYEVFTQPMFSPSITDNCSATTWKFVGCQSDQPADVRGGSDGNTAVDCVVDPAGAWFKVRAERDSKKPAGRRYAVTIVAMDACGNTSDTEQIGNIFVSVKQPPPGCLVPDGGM